MAVSPDGTMLASAGWDHQAKVWDADSRRLRLGVEDANAVAFSNDSAWLFTASEQGQVQVWDIATRCQLAAFGLEVHPTGRRHARLAVSPAEPVLAVCTDGDLFGTAGVTSSTQHRVFMALLGDARNYRATVKVILSDPAAGHANS
jgi:WD40 repeat protein